MNENKKQTILVVDNSVTSRQSLVQILEDDYIIHTAASGVEAFQVARDERPDIILLDIIMPQMDGYETLSVLRKEAETKDIPVIFITGLDQECDEEKGLSLGADDYISKPYNPVIVKLRIRVLLKVVSQMRTINELSMMDIVSKLPNRNYFDKRLREEWQRALSENRQLGILMVDVDKFRTYSAIYGYNHSDKTIASVAKIITENALLSPGDLAARWAHDGFVVLVQNASNNECSAIGEKIRKVIEDTVFVTKDGENTRITISVGVNSVMPASGEFTMEQLISNTDSALYLAKELGHNQVVVHS